MAVFGAVLKLEDMPYIRVMTGRMRGQAFVECSCKDITNNEVLWCNFLMHKNILGVEHAVTALKAVNGFLIKEKPVVISYGIHEQN